MTRLAIAAALGLTCVVVGCGRDADGSTASVITEVDGVRHVTLPAHDRLDVPEWDLTETYNTSSDGAKVELFRVVGARLLEDGSLVIANSGTNELLHLDSAGKIQGRYGREGGGPGEYKSIASIDIDRSGMLVVYDPREIRLTRISADGQVVETSRLSSDDPVVGLLPLAETADGKFLAVFGEARIFRRSAEFRDTIPLLIVDPAAETWDTIAAWPAQEWAGVEVGGGVARSEIGFGRALAYSGRNGSVAIGSTDSLDIHVFDETGRRSMRLAGWGADRQVTPAAVERWRSGVLDRLRQVPEELRVALGQAPHRNTYPAFQRLLVDDRGRIWIGLYPPPGEPQDWIVVDKEGHVAGRVTVPPESRLLDAAGDQLVVAGRTELDEEYVSVLRVNEDR